MTASIELVLPGLFDLPAEDLDPEWLGRELPHLNRLLRLSQTRVGNAYGLDQILSMALGLEPQESGHSCGLPMAQAFAEKPAPAAHRMLLAQAIHLQADLHSAVIVPIPSNLKNNADISILIKDLSALFKVDFDVSDLADGVFLLRLHAIDAPTHYVHLLSALGKTAGSFMQQSRRDLAWYRLMNEIQMFLHQHPVNQQRLLQGLLPINSLWFWGGGQVPAIANHRLAWFCDDSLLNDFVAGLGLKPRPCLEVSTQDSDEDMVVVDLRLLEYLKLGRSLELSQLLQEIDSCLVKPLIERVEQQRSRLYLRAGFEIDFEYKFQDRIKFWRQPRHLGHWIGYSEQL